MQAKWGGEHGVRAKRRHANYFETAQRPAFESRSPVRFPTREAFEAFVAETIDWAGAQPSFRVYYPSGHDIMAAFSVEDLFRISADRLDFLAVFTPAGEMRFDYRRGSLIQVFPAVGREASAGEWVSIADRHLRSVPPLRRWRRFSIASRD